MFFDDARDCTKPDPARPDSTNDHQNCAVDRIDFYALILSDTEKSKTDHLEALKYLIHFVGDLHQPLHAMDEARGGNEIRIIQFGSPMCGPDS